MTMTATTENATPTPPKLELVPGGKGKAKPAKFRLADRNTAPVSQLLDALERTTSDRTVKMLRKEIVVRARGRGGWPAMPWAEIGKLIAHDDTELAAEVLKYWHRKPTLTALLRMLDDPREPVADEARAEIISRMEGDRRRPEWRPSAQLTPDQARKLVHHPDTAIAAAAVRCAASVLSDRTLRSLARSEQVEVANLAAALIAKARYEACSKLSDDELRAVLVKSPKDAAAWRVAAVRMRGEITGPTSFIGLYDRSDLEVTDRQIVDGDALLLEHVEGWHAYRGGAPARYRAASYIGGISGDGTGAWAARVSSSITSVRGALEELEPAAVKNAREKSKRVVRQGDVYAVETTPAHEDAYAPGRHDWDRETRVLSHPEHAAVTIPYPVRFVEQTARAMVGSGARYGD